METSYMEAITPSNHNCSDFHPKDDQKAVYRWYDRKYSEAAWDIYSHDWETRIIEWHQAWHAAHQSALQETNPNLNNDRKLESLPMGKFFLAHPIAGFSLWRVLQSCYALDRAVCGDSDEVTSWQEWVPFQYLKADKIDLQWQTELEHFKQQIASSRLNLRKQPWEMRLFNMHRGLEEFEKEFAALKENFRENLSESKFRFWMIERIEAGMGKRIAMITDLLKFKENELEDVQSVNSQEDGINDIEQVPSPVYSRQGTIPPSYSSPLKTNFPPGIIPMIEPFKPASEPQAPVNKPAAKGGVMSSIKKGYQKMKRKVRKSKSSKKSRSPR
ncbi:hypothetical protein IFR04_003053 [Cadophora malorum]|uniref:Uncharacterized protein n=1 Tax=Cadophora malorum TaxID=108018 RepID=A0A8H8BTV8_9HELO|nr:hypothetical protein IFR04_003053 [Cadophora malorum]